jgi:hypothetical protein
MSTKSLGPMQNCCVAAGDEGLCSQVGNALTVAAFGDCGLRSIRADRFRASL